MPARSIAADQVRPSSSFGCTSRYQPFSACPRPTGVRTASTITTSRPFTCSSSRGHETAVDVDRGADEEARVVGREELDRGGDLLLAAEPAERRPRSLRGAQRVL